MESQTDKESTLMWHPTERFSGIHQLNTDEASYWVLAHQWRVEDAALMLEGVSPTSIAQHGDPSEQEMASTQIESMRHTLRHFFGAEAAAEADSWSPTTWIQKASQLGANLPPVLKSHFTNAISEKSGQSDIDPRERKSLLAVVKVLSKMSGLSLENFSKDAAAVVHAADKYGIPISTGTVVKFLKEAAAAPGRKHRRS